MLLIACANVANLFLARATTRQREMAMRLALGAGRGRLARQMLTESLLLSLAAGLLGLVLTFGAVKLLVSTCPVYLPRLQETNVDLRVLGFTLGVSLLTGLLFGLVPAWRASDIGVNETLKQGTGRTTGARRWRHIHDGLVVSQLSLSLVLLIGAALLIRTLVALQAVDLGFQPQNILAVGFELPWAKYLETEQCNNFFCPLLERIGTLPSVRSVGACNHNLFSSPDAWAGEFTIAGLSGPEQSRSARWIEATPGFFDAVGMRWLAGYAFDDQDPDAIVIDETVARECFPNSEALGRTFMTGDSPEQKAHTIVGVVETIHSFDTPGQVVGTIYTQLTKYTQWTGVLVRTDGDPMRLAPAIQEFVAQLEKDQVISSIEPMEATLSGMEATLSGMLVYRRFVMTLLGIFAGIALALATIGIYALLQYNTTRQTRDIGIRMALGAQGRDVVRAVLTQGLKLILIGIIVGVVGAVALTRVLSSLLYDVPPHRSGDTRVGLRCIDDHRRTGQLPPGS